MAVDEVALPHVLGVLKPIWVKTPPTASRVRGRIEMVLDYATAHGLRGDSNPASWKILQHVLPRLAAVSRDHLAAMRYEDVPAFVAELREKYLIGARALEFTILTAARAGETLGATWSEINLATKVWTVPASRMKAGKEHRVPLSSHAVAIIARLAEFRSSDFIFPNRSDRRMQSKAMRNYCTEGVTVHGFRSAFRDWAGNETHAAREICEAALAHTIGNAVEAAYRRSDALEKRRALMTQWAVFCEGGDVGANVVPMRQGSK